MRNSSSTNQSGNFDKELQDLLENTTIEELLKKDDAWVQIIEISKKLWTKKLPDDQIMQFLKDYDDLQERKLME